MWILERLVGRRYETLEEVKHDIEVLTGEKVKSIAESECDRFEELDYMIDFELGTDWECFTIFYLKDNVGRYYITEV